MNFSRTAYFFLMFTSQIIWASDSSLEVKDWFALGSGCRGNSKGEGTIRMEKSSQKNIWKLKFHMQGFHLDSNQPISKSRPTFARECSLRVGVHPKERYRIRHVRASWNYKMNKSKGVSAEIYSHLIAGPKSLSRWYKELKPEKEIANSNLHIQMKPSLVGKENLAKVGCGQAKIIGLDLSIINRKKSFTPQLRVELDKEQPLLLEMEVEAC